MKLLTGREDTMGITVEREGDIAIGVVRGERFATGFHRYVQAACGLRCHNLPSLHVNDVFC